MPFEYACFISYCHDEGKLMTGLMKQLEEALNSTLALYLKNKKVYIDKELLPGAVHKEELAIAICKSICMVVIYSPSYEQSDYCLKEFKAMEKIEEKRIQRMQLCGKSIKKGMIIPIVLRGGDKLPPEIKERNYIDFSKVSLASFIKNIFRNEKIIGQIDKIAKTIQKHDEDLTEIADVCCGKCISFKLPTEVMSWSNAPPSGFNAPPFPKM